MFGNKIVDFNFDSSAFKNIDSIVKGLTRNGMLMGDKRRLVLFCQVQGEKFEFEVPFNREGNLIQNRELIEKDDIDEYLRRHTNKLFLTGKSKGITKEEFMRETEEIPYMNDLIRQETLFRDRILEKHRPKTKIKQDIVVLLNIEEALIIFRFSNGMQPQEGVLDKVDGSTFRISMGSVCEEDVIADLRERMTRALEKNIASCEELRLVNSEKNIMLELNGTREFVVKVQQWEKADEFDRLAKYCLEQNEVIVKMERVRALGGFSEDKEQGGGYDCYSLYRHSDLSYEWRLCKIVNREQKRDESGKEDMQFYYWIEFLHLRELGCEILFKRERTEVLMGARFAREQKRNFEQTTKKFINKLYSSVRLDHA